MHDNKNGLALIANYDSAHEDTQNEEPSELANINEEPEPDIDIFEMYIKCKLPK